MAHGWVGPLPGHRPLMLRHQNSDHSDAGGQGWPHHPPTVREAIHCKKNAEQKQQIFLFLNYVQTEENQLRCHGTLTEAVQRGFINNSLLAPTTAAQNAPVGETGWEFPSNRKTWREGKEGLKGGKDSSGGFDH